MDGNYLFALTAKGEQYCKAIIDDLNRAALPKKNLKENEEILSTSEHRSGFDQIQKELYNIYGLNWLAKDYFEDHKSSNNDLDNWRKGFSFELPSVKSKKELRRQRIIADIKTKLENQKKVLIVGQSGSSKSTILMELMCDYFDAGYEIFYNKVSGLKNIDGLVNFIECRLKMNEKILVAIDDAHNDRTMTLYDMVRQNYVPIKLFEVVFKESISHKPLFLSNEKVSRVFTWISDAYIALKDFRGGLDNSNEALTWDSDDTMAYMYKGIALTELGRNEEAVECFDKAQDIDLGRPWVWMYLVSRWRSLDCLGRRKEALACLDKVLEIDPNNRDAYVTLGSCFGLMGMHEKAIECCDKALKMNNPFIKLLEGIPFYIPIPSDEDVLCMIHSLKGTSFLKVGKPDEAMSCFNKVLEINPDDTYALYEKGKVLVELRKYSEAVDCYDHVLKIDSNRGDVWYYKGQALLTIDRIDAQYCFDKAKKLGFNINSQEGELAEPH